MEKKKICDIEALPTLVKDALDLMHESFPYLYGAGDVAEELEVSVAHLIRQFKKYVGETPTNYLIRYKLEKSKELLGDESLYIDTIANVVGFSCGNYYAKVFRKYYGISPSQYILENPRKSDLAPQGDSFQDIYL